MITLFASLHKNRRLLRDFVVRDLKARYVGSSMGFFWSVLFPIINLFVYMFVFRAVLNARWSDHQGPLEVALIMLAGIVVWAAFAETVSRSTNSLVENANLIQKVVFPSELLPPYLAVSSLINMCIGLPVVVLCTAWFSIVQPPTLEFADAAQTLGEQGGTSVATVQLTRGSPHDVLVKLGCRGSATRGEDFDLPRLELEIKSGALTAGVPIEALADERVEGEELLELYFESVDGARAGGTITHVVTLSEANPKAAGIAEGWSAERLAQRSGPGPLDPAYSPLGLGAALLSLPLLFVLQFLFTTGLGYALAALNLYLRDTYHLVGVFITVWMFGTPIFYPAVMVEKAELGWILALNPMHWLIDSYRATLLYGDWPRLWNLVRFAAVSLVAFGLGGRFFLSQKHRFPDLL